MEDIVAVAVKLNNEERRYFLTWGRIQDRSDPAPLEAVVLTHCTRFALGGTPVSATVCDSLQEAASQPYFYECFFSLCRKSVPFGPRYVAWTKEIAEAMAKGKEIYYLGRPPTTSQGGAKEGGKIAFGADNWP